MAWEIEGTDEFEAWFDGLTEQDRRSATAVVDLLETFGPRLGYPYSSSVLGSRHGHMRELRAQSGGRPLRILYAFDPRRTAILL
ncbi:MAG TPA: type II toxin-antitoxin system RelE/ParE family toxin, partial [Longimicrobium sp.]|nr:type II toxin-antitoxin system RelE/ParE family toxin [Longimicrobium sp.]